MPCASTSAALVTPSPRFIIAPTGDDFRVYSDGELARENAATREGKSPGFFITNKTMWPVSISIEQAGTWAMRPRPG